MVGHVEKMGEERISKHIYFIDTNDEGEEWWIETNLDGRNKEIKIRAKLATRRLGKQKRMETWNHKA